jgi:hypothetical protein
MKKIILFVFLTINCLAFAQGYPAQEGYQAFPNDNRTIPTYNQEDKRSIERNEARIDEIRKSISDPYWKSNAFFILTTAFLLTMVGSIYHHNGNAGLASFSGLALSAGTGVYIKGSEANKINECNQEIKELEERNEKIRSRYRVAPSQQQ